MKAKKGKFCNFERQCVDLTILIEKFSQRIFPFFRCVRLSLKSSSLFIHPSLQVLKVLLQMTFFFFNNWQQLKGMSWARHDCCCCCKRKKIFNNLLYFSVVLTKTFFLSTASSTTAAAATCCCCCFCKKSFIFHILPLLLLNLQKNNINRKKVYFCSTAGKHIRKL